MTAWQAICLIVALLSFALAAYNTNRAHKILRKEIKTEENIVNDQEKVHYLSFSPENADEAPQLGLIAAWNKVPGSVITGPWWFLCIPLTIMGM